MRARFAGGGGASSLGATCPRTGLLGLILRSGQFRPTDPLRPRHGVWHSGKEAVVAIPVHRGGGAQCTCLPSTQLGLVTRQSAGLADLLIIDSPGKDALDSIVERSKKYFIELWSIQYDDGQA
jgi:hypothetical protein